MVHLRIFNGTCDALSFSIKWSSMPLLMTFVFSYWSLWIRFCLPFSLAMFFLRGAAFFCCGLFALPFLPPCTILSMLRLIKQAFAEAPKWHKIMKKGALLIDNERIRQHGANQQIIFNFFRHRSDQVDLVSMLQFIHKMGNESRFIRLLSDYQPKIIENLKEMDMKRLFNYKYLLHYSIKSKPVIIQIITALIGELVTRKLSPSELSYLLEDIFQYRLEQAERMIAIYRQSSNEFRHEQMTTLDIIYSEDRALTQLIIDLRNTMAIAKYSNSTINRQQFTMRYQKLFDILEQDDWARLKEISLKDYSIRIFLLPLDGKLIIRQRILNRLVKLYERLLFDCLSQSQVSLRPQDQTIAIQYLRQNLTQIDYKQFEHILQEIQRYLPDHPIQLILLADKMKYVGVHMARYLLQLDFQNIRNIYQAGAILKLLDQQLLNAFFGQRIALVEMEGLRVRLQNSLRQLYHRMPGVYYDFFRMYNYDHQLQGIQINNVKIQSFISAMFFIKNNKIPCPRLKHCALSVYSLLAINYLQTINPTLIPQNNEMTNTQSAFMQSPSNVFMEQLTLMVKPGVTVNYREKGFLMHFVKGQKHGCFVVGIEDQIEGAGLKVIGGISKLALEYWRVSGWVVEIVKENEGELPTNFFTY